MTSPQDTFKTRSIYDGMEHNRCKLSTNSQQRYLDICCKLANKSSLAHKHGCIIVKNGKIISQAFNTKLIAKLYESVPTSIHAEVAAIKKVKNKNQLNGNCELYVVRVGTPNHYTTKYSKPCETCTHFINKFKIRTVYYSVNV